MHLNKGMKIYKEWIDSIEAQACVREKKTFPVTFVKSLDPTWAIALPLLWHSINPNLYQLIVVGLGEARHAVAQLLTMIQDFLEQ